MLSAFCKLFNIVFTSDVIHSSWTEGIICPIYKNKGDANNSDNYAVLGNYLPLYLTIGLTVI